MFLQTPRSLSLFKNALQVTWSGHLTSFHGVMDKALKNVQDCAVAYIAYIDDILAFSADWEMHMGYLQRVFQALCQAGLTVKLTTSHMVCHYVRHLGFQIGGGRIWAIPDKLATLKSTI